jgi:hypothetical protein
MLAEAAKVAANTVVAALEKASAATGVDFSYLLGTAMRESGLKPTAKSGQSSATGLFQFIEQTWLSLVKDYGSKHGLGSYANAITKTADGRCRVANAEDRSAILRLRNDPQISALMAGEYTKMTQAQMEDSLGRKVSKGELYAAHLLGAGSACKLIRSAQGAPSSAACDLFPREADANRNIFYHADGRPKTVREVYNWTTANLTSGLTPTAKMNAKTEVPSVSTGALDTATTAAMLASLWQPRHRSFFGNSDESASGNAPPFAMSPAILDVLQTVAQKHGKK